MCPNEVLLYRRFDPMTVSPAPGRALGPIMSFLRLPSTSSPSCLFVHNSKRPVLLYEVTNNLEPNKLEKHCWVGEECQPQERTVWASYCLRLKTIFHYRTEGFPHFSTYLSGQSHVLRLPILCTKFQPNLTFWAASSLLSLLSVILLSKLLLEVSLPHLPHIPSPVFTEPIPTYPSEFGLLVYVSKELFLDAPRFSLNDIPRGCHYTL